ncbi:MAG: hypothetical protein RRZ69_07690, partial [Clostridia bacterium]
VVFFNSAVENAILNWCLSNNLPAGIGTDTLRNAQAIYIPLKLSNDKIACIAIACHKSKLSVTDKIFFSQIKNTLLSLLVKQGVIST